MSQNVQILQYFDPAHFIPDLKASTKDAALEEMIAVISRSGGIRDPELLLDMLKRRESLGSTGIGKGVAIPHGRSLAVVNLRVLFARSVSGVAFEAIDGKPVKIFFLIVAPFQDKANEYLPLLGKLAELAGTKKWRDRLVKIEAFAELRAVLEEAAAGE